MSLSKFLIGLLLVAGLVLLILTNLGILSFRNPYIRQLSNDLPAPQPAVAFVDVNLVPMDSERFLEGQTKSIPVGADTAYQITVEHLQNHWDASTVGVVLASPSNPTGRC